MFFTAGRFRRFASGGRRRPAGHLHAIRHYVFRQILWRQEHPRRVHQGGALRPMDRNDRLASGLTFWNFSTYLKKNIQFRIGSGGVSAEFRANRNKGCFLFLPLLGRSVDPTISRNRRERGRRHTGGYVRLAESNVRVSWSRVMHTDNDQPRDNLVAYELSLTI